MLQRLTVASGTTLTYSGFRSNWTAALTVMRGLDPRIHLLAKRMDCTGARVRIIVKRLKSGKPT